MITGTDDLMSSKSFNENGKSRARLTVGVILINVSDHTDVWEVKVV